MAILANSGRSLRKTYPLNESLPAYIATQAVEPGGTIQDGAGLPLRGVVMQHYDGDGNLTQVDHIVVNGMPPPVGWTPGSGTYAVNRNCTGTAVIDTASSPFGPLNIHFVVVGEGKEIHQVVDGNAVIAVGKRVE